MIHQNCHVGKTHPVTVAEFGHGTIGIVLAEYPDKKAIMLKTQEYAPIGSFKAHGCENDSDKWKPEVIMTFKNVEGLDSLIDSLQELKESFIMTKPIN